MKTLRTLVLSALVLGGTAIPLAAQADPPAAVAQMESPARGKPFSRAEAQSLAQREKKSEDLAKYEGGHLVIAISTLGVVIIAVIVLLLVL